MAERRGSAERATTLLLFPAAVLVLIVLAAIAIDMSMIHLTRREVVRAASHAADDAAALIELDGLRRGEPVSIDLVAATRLVRTELAAARLPGRIVDGPRVERVSGSATVSVTLTVEVAHIFARGVPGGPDSERFTVRVEARLLDVTDP